MSDDDYYRRPVSMSLTELNAGEDDGSESGLPTAIEFDADFEVLFHRYFSTFRKVYFFCLSPFTIICWSAFDHSNCLKE